MGPAAKKKLEALKAALPPGEKPFAGDRQKLKDTLSQISGVMDVVNDLCVDKPKEVKEEFLQSILVEAKGIVDRVMKLAKDDKIEFSFLGMDVQYQGNEPELVHPDTDKVRELEDMRDNDWDSSSRSCPGG